MLLTDVTPNVFDPLKTIFGGAINRNSIFLMFFITITYPLHVSAPTGHLQVEYIYTYIYIYTY
jgi:hypothetical protein